MGASEFDMLLPWSRFIGLKCGADMTPDKPLVSCHKNSIHQKTPNKVESMR